MSVPKTLALSVCHTASFITLKLIPVDPGMVSSPAAEACKQLLEEPWQARDDLEQPSWSCDWGETKLDQGCKGVGSLCFFHTQRKMVQMIYRFKCIKVFLAQLLQLPGRGHLGALAFVGGRDRGPQGVGFLDGDHGGESGWGQG